VAGTFTIPLTTLAVGAHHFPPSGGYAAADADTGVSLLINRTVTGGLSTAPATTTAQVTAEQSGDGGTTWDLVVSAQLTGGPQDDKTGSPSPASETGGRLPAGTGRTERATVTVAGASVAVSGTLTVLT
jgi:hypothetical protein